MIKRKFFTQWYLLVLLMLSNCINAFSFQEIVIKGKVSDSGGGIPGVSVKLKGSSINAISDERGNYSISTSAATGTLVFTSVGYDVQDSDQ